MDELRPGLWTWTAPHPDWTPDQGGPDGWDRDVRCYAYDAGETLVLLDPLDPPEPLTRRGTEQGTAVILTCPWHQRSARTLVDSVSAIVYAPEGFDERLEAPAQAFRPEETLPGGVQAKRSFDASEAVLWLPAHGALVFGDALIGGGENGIRVPEAWLGETSPEEYRASLRHLLDLPVELLLPTHGEPVADGALEALRRELAA